MAALNEDQSMIRDQAETWVNDQAPVNMFRKMRDSNAEFGYDPEIWSQIVELGWTGIIVPEVYGGSNLGYLTFGLILEQLGKQLTASPLFASAYVGASAILLAGDETQKSSILPKIIDGSEILTLAADEKPRHAPFEIETTATLSGDGYKLNGRKVLVMEGMAATTVILAARTSGSSNDKSGITLFLVPMNSPGLSREKLNTMDSRGYANITFSDVSVSTSAVLGTIDQAGDTLEVVLDRARAGIAAEMIGNAFTAFDMTLEYLRTRKQFGSVIGSFQALGHRAAQMFTAQELAKSCAEAALQAIDTGAKDSAEMCSLSKCKVGEYLYLTSNEMIQMHGGIGMTDEYNAGLFLKRARALETLFGSRGFHRNRFASLNGF